MTSTIIGDCKNSFYEAPLTAITPITPANLTFYIINDESCTFDVLSRYLLFGSVADVTHELEVVQVDLVRVDIPEVGKYLNKIEV